MKLTKATRSGSTWIEREDGHPVALMMAGSMPNCDEQADAIIGVFNAHDRLAYERDKFEGHLIAANSQRARLFEQRDQLTAGLLSNGCEFVTDDDGNLLVRNVRAEKALAENVLMAADLVAQRFAVQSHVATVEAMTRVNHGLVQALQEIRKCTNAKCAMSCLAIEDIANAALRQAGQT